MTVQLLLQNPKLSILSVLSGGKIAIQTGPASSSQGQNCYITSPARLAKVHFFSNTYLISRLVSIWPA